MVVVEVVGEDEQSPGCGGKWYGEMELVQQGLVVRWVLLLLIAELVRCCGFVVGICDGQVLWERIGVGMGL